MPRPVLPLDVDASIGKRTHCFIVCRRTIRRRARLLPPPERPPVARLEPEPTPKHERDAQEVKPLTDPAYPTSTLIHTEEQRQEYFMRLTRPSAGALGNAVMLASSCDKK